MIQICCPKYDKVRDLILQPLQSKPGRLFFCKLTCDVVCLRFSRDLYVVHDLMLSFASPSLPPSSFKFVLSTADAQAWSSGDSLLSVSESDFDEMR